ncbi:BTAD domain-containing putative transcriptional regulator [Kibdelosporangium aridum]|uniref:Predicted ATPase n=1 Tax=Kibdelosporangium aridum TaxID=2030 RepID=A0A1Y5XK77_KIBAR|nr:BTAD domain-containing putative transcriptional regulator [Kibdelosporangium aridum]SMD00283.1 Predicted ATPase [Kibdelosporangium aridum]
MRVAVLGPLSLTDGADQQIEVGGPRLRMLLVRLALEANRIVPTEALIDGLWGTQPPVDATNALQSLVSRLRKTGLAKRIESYPAGYSLAATEVDADTFERLAAEGSRLLKQNDVVRAAEVLTRALDLWRGPALVDVADAPFAAAAVARLAELRLTALEDRIEADIRRGHEVDVIAELHALTRENPLRERLTALLIRALRKTGRQADALAAYETARQNLAAELGVDPSPELQEAHLSLLRSTPAEVPNSGTRLPAQLTSFVGRAHELGELEGMLDRDRLITLVGPGGAGKTRLATEAASRIADRVWFVHLAGLREAVDVPVALVTELGLGDSTVTDNPRRWHRSVDVMTRLLDALEDRSELIVLDNCEHVVSAVAHLAEALLAGCPRLRILTTSREPLAITGETLFPVGPLELPEEDASAHQAIESAAVRLFLDRARSVRPGFTVDESNVVDVVSICRQLDGLPLALELAAARLRSMTVGQVAERLDDRFRLLAGGSRTSLPRHQTLGAVVEWSWSLLTEAEQTLASRLSVFANPSTLEAITAVCADEALPADDVLYVLASLVEKSLVEAGEGPDGPPRYRMLQTVKAFAAERLGDTEQVMNRFARWVMVTTEHADPLLRGPDQVQWLKMLDAERENVVAAVRYAVDQGDAETSFRIVHSWAWYWLVRQGIFGETLTEQILPIGRMLQLEDRAPQHTVVLIRMLSVLGGIEEPRWHEINRIVELCRAGYEKASPLTVLMETTGLGMLGDFAGAGVAFRHALRNPDPWARASVVLGGAIMAENLGQFEQSKRWHTAAIRRFRKIGDRWGLSMALNGLAVHRSTIGDIAGAIELHTEARALELELGQLPDPAMTTSRLAEQYYRLGDLDRARSELERLVALTAKTGQRAITMGVLARLSLVARASGDLVGARAHVTAARRELRNWPENLSDPFCAWVGIVEGLLLVSEGDLARAKVVVAEALDVTTSGIGYITEARQDLEKNRLIAAEALDAVQHGIGYMRDAQSISDVGECLAVVVAAEGDLRAAARLLGASAAIAGALDVGSPENLALLAKFGPAEHEILAQARKLPPDKALEVLRQGVSVPPPETP